jgi:hypothetical protein
VTRPYTTAEARPEPIRPHPRDCDTCNRGDRDAALLTGDVVHDPNQGALEASHAIAQVANDRNWPGQGLPALRRAYVAHGQDGARLSTSTR